MKKYWAARREQNASLPIAPNLELPLVAREVRTGLPMKRHIRAVSAFPVSVVGPKVNAMRLQPICGLAF